MVDFEGSHIAIRSRMDGVRLESSPHISVACTSVMDPRRRSELVVGVNEAIQGI